MRVLGIEKVDYVSRKTNNRVEGLNLHCVSEPVSTDRMDGQQVERVFISARSAAYASLSGIRIGQDVKFLYNRYGNVDDVVIQPDAAPEKAGK
ncbi:MAG: hypothetical protein NC305_04025 [Lachnospiraceae bacterium]|nr:hypothetical protein [Muribaculaceae bacterium]MCM1409699.1 hypothetical protein [Lachnospiraceae bacterium]